MWNRLRIWFSNVAIEDALNWFITQDSSFILISNNDDFELNETRKVFEFTYPSLARLTLVQRTSSNGFIQRNIICLDGKPVWEAVNYNAKSYDATHWTVERLNYGKWCEQLFLVYLDEYAAWQKVEREKKKALFSPLDE